MGEGVRNSEPWDGPRASRHIHSRFLDKPTLGQNKAAVSRCSIRPTAALCESS